MQKREQHNLTKTREYNSWSGMRSRIYNPKNKKEIFERLNIVEQRGRYKEKT
jgi:hypothetical protein